MKSLENFNYSGSKPSEIIKEIFITLGMLLFAMLFWPVILLYSLFSPAILDLFPKLIDDFREERFWLKYKKHIKETRE